MSTSRTVDLPCPPEGFDWSTGTRLPKMGEWYYSWRCGRIQSAAGDFRLGTDSLVFVLEPICVTPPPIPPPAGFRWSKDPRLPKQGDRYYYPPKGSIIGAMCDHEGGFNAALRFILDPIEDNVSPAILVPVVWNAEARLEKGYQQWQLVHEGAHRLCIKGSPPALGTLLDSHKGELVYRLSLWKFPDGAERRVPIWNGRKADRSIWDLQKDETNG